jgi:hypothetical protein
MAYEFNNKNDNSHCPWPSLSAAGYLLLNFFYKIYNMKSKSPLPLVACPIPHPPIDKSPVFSHCSFRGNGHRGPKQLRLANFGCWSQCFSDHPEWTSPRRVMAKNWNWTKMLNAHTQGRSHWGKIGLNTNKYIINLIIFL